MNSYLDTNVLIANFSPADDINFKNKNVLIYEKAVENGRRVLISPMVLCEFYHQKFKKTYKKILQEQKKNHKIPVNEALKDQDVVAKFNAIFGLIINSLKNDGIKIKIDTDDLTQSIYEYKISPSDYLIWLHSRNHVLYTGDDDLKKFIQNKSNRKRQTKFLNY